MKTRTPQLVGIFTAFFACWVGLVLVPYFQVGRLLPEVDANTKEQYPPLPPGQAEQGRAVYAANGCVYCHTQQVKPGADIERGWGERRTVSRDYIRDVEAYVGNQRIGPDLANIGSRKPASPDDKYKYTVAWHYQHLYQPDVVTPGSMMPPMKFLFEKRKVVGQRSVDAIQVEGEDAKKLKPDEEIVPSAQAKALVAYLMNLKRSSYPLTEAPPPAPNE